MPYIFLNNINNNNKIMSEVHFVIEHCCDCISHYGTTHHIEEKYIRYANTLQEELGGPEMCLANHIPAVWRQSPLIKSQMKVKKARKSTPDDELIRIKPRMGSFEVFVNIGVP